MATSPPPADRSADIRALAAPLLLSRALARLGSVTFLGVLSPRFRHDARGLLWGDAPAPPPDDGTRLDHTLGVTGFALDLAERMRLSHSGRLHAVAWGLTHDIGTWPLSHTGEAAFAAATGWMASALREAILLGSGEMPRSIRLDAALREMGVDPGVLVRLFGDDGDALSDELAAFRGAIRSPLTPDTLEGVARSGLTFGVEVAPAAGLTAGFSRRGRHAEFDREFLPAARLFWESKSAVYRRFINRPDVVAWESAWSATVARLFAGVSLAESLELSEAAIVRRVARAGLAPAGGVVRYKPPHDYFYAAAAAAAAAAAPYLPAEDLRLLLRRQPVTTTTP